MVKGEGQGNQPGSLVAGHRAGPRTEQEIVGSPSLEPDPRRPDLYPFAQIDRCLVGGRARDRDLRGAGIGPAQQIAGTGSGATEVGRGALR